MELLQLRYFCYAAKKESFSAAAKHFGVPASDISQSIKRLETELGSPLFVRTPNSVKLSEKGKRFLPDVTKALRLLDSGARELSDDGETGEIKIAILINRRIVMETVENFRREYPGVEFTVSHSISDPDDFGLIVTDNDMTARGFSCEKLLSEDIMLAVRRDHPLATAQSITAKELKDTPFIAMSPGHSQYDLTCRIAKEMGFTPRIAVQSDDPFYIRRCVELGLGACFVPVFSWKGQFSDSVIFKRVGDYRREAFLCRDPHRHLSLAARRFAEMLIKACKK